MQKLIGFGIVGSSLCSLSCFAQSSVTLYGIIDEGVNYTSNVATTSGGKPLFNLSSGVLQGSRWGMKGVEDLGGGLKALATLENGFDVNNGRLSQGGLLFGRQAFVGVSSNQAGTVTLGRQYDSVVDYVAPVAISHQWGGYIGAHPGDIDNFNNGQRTSVRPARTDDLIGMCRHEPTYHRIRSVCRRGGQSGSGTVAEEADVCIPHIQITCPKLEGALTIPGPHGPNLVLSFVSSDASKTIKSAEV